MPGINLSQSAVLAETEEGRVSASSKAISVSFALLLLTGLAYGVLWYFSYRLDQKQMALTKKITETKAQYASDLVTRVAKFSLKSDAVMTKRSYPDVNPADELRVMSSVILPDVVLDSYGNDLSSNAVQISGEAKTLLQVAQQMKAFQDSGNFSGVSLGGPLVRGEGGKITFSLLLSRVSDEQKNK